MDATACLFLLRGKCKRRVEQGASAYERGTVNPRSGMLQSAPQPVRIRVPHATIRPFQLTADELAAAPAQTKSRDNKPANEYKFVMAVSPLDCMGCGECVTVCPTKAITMVPQDSLWQISRQSSTTALPTSLKKPSKFADDTVIALSSTSRCWSSPAPAGVPRDLTLA